MQIIGIVASYAAVVLSALILQGGGSNQNMRRQDYRNHHRGHARGSLRVSLPVYRSHTILKYCDFYSSQRFISTLLAVCGKPG